MRLAAATSVLKTPVYYWGEGGQYGPFDVQEQGEWAGWPDFGQVLRYFRKQAKLSAKAFGELYGKAVNVDGSAIGERWILDMELENKVPVDIGRRKTIAQLLKIPPMLLGLAVLDDMTLESLAQAPQRVAIGQTKLVRTSVDTLKYQNTTRKIWQLHETSNALSELIPLLAEIRDLESFERQTQGDLRYHVQEMLLSNHILATHIVRDQRQFSRAYYHSNEAVQVAKSMDESDLIATALFTRGRTRMEWGAFGTTQQGVFQVQQDKLKGAIGDFQEALDLFPGKNDKESMHPQLLGVLMTEMKRTQALLAVSKGERLPASLLVALDEVEDTVSKQHIDDPNLRVLIKGSRGAWQKASYLNIRTTIFTIAGYPGQALRELKAGEQLREGRYNRDETRRFTWEDIQKAHVYMGMGEFGEATRHAKRALLACQDINSITNIAIVTDIYGRLLKSSYKGSGDVQELGNILRESPLTFIQPL